MLGFLFEITEFLRVQVVFRFRISPVTFFLSVLSKSLRRSKTFMSCVGNGRSTGPITLSVQKFVLRVLHTCDGTLCRTGDSLNFKGLHPGTVRLSGATGVINLAVTSLP